MRAVSGVRRAPQQHVNYDRVMTDLRTRLDGAAFERVWAAGHELAPEAALNDALVMLQRHASAAPQDVADRSAEVSTWPLTPREAEVATLIAQGQTSKEIADTLLITERTADTHASHIREKLGLGSRAEIAAWAVRHGLVAEEETPAR